MILLDYVSSSYRDNPIRSPHARRKPELTCGAFAALLGHSRIQMVMRYAHPSEQHQFEAMKMIEKSRAVKKETHERAS
ncbi:MAG: hypothetical protein M3R15_23930 [Acidobacteriota bacterium]|nr:hypothetical protein [Acidobacteriota bacterium]